MQQAYQHVLAHDTKSASELTKAGTHEKPGPRLQQGGDEPAALRTYTIPSPLDAGVRSPFWAFELATLFSRLPATT
jgi:hypothetical protein